MCILLKAKTLTLQREANVKTVRNISNLLNLNPLLAVVLLIVTVLAIITSIPGCSSDSESEETKVSSENPITVIDALGQELSFTSVPEKIATISPTATEMLYAAGGTSILRDRASNFPSEAASLPDVGSAYNPSIETIMSTQPDLVIIEALTQARFVGPLSQSGLKVLAVKAETKEDIISGISNLGTILNTENIANKKTEDIVERLDAAKSDDDRSVLILISDQDQSLYAARPESYTGLIAELVGLHNKAEGLPDSGPFPGFALVSPEFILGADPDIILTISPAPEPAPRLSDSIKRIPPFARLTAIQQNNVFEADVTLFLQSPGPRIVDAVEFLDQKVNSN